MKYLILLFLLAGCSEQTMAPEEAARIEIKKVKENDLAKNWKSKCYLITDNRNKAEWSKMTAKWICKDTYKSMEKCYMLIFYSHISKREGGVATVELSCSLKVIGNVFK